MCCRYVSICMCTYNITLCIIHVCMQKCFKNSLQTKKSLGWRTRYLWNKYHTLNLEEIWLLYVDNAKTFLRDTKNLNFAIFLITLPSFSFFILTTMMLVCCRFRILIGQLICSESLNSFYGILILTRCMLRTEGNALNTITFVLYFWYLVWK